MAKDSKKQKKGSGSGAVQTEGSKPSDSEAQEPEASLAGVHSTGITVEDLEIALEDLIVGYVRVLGPGVRVRIKITTGTTKQDCLREVLVGVDLRLGKKKKKIAKDNTLGTVLKRMLDADGSEWAGKQRERGRKSDNTI